MVALQREGEDGSGRRRGRGGFSVKPACMGERKERVRESSVGSAVCAQSSKRLKKGERGGGLKLEAGERFCMSTSTQQASAAGRMEPAPKQSKSRSKSKAPCLACLYRSRAEQSRGHLASDAERQGWVGVRGLERTTANR
mmetsp:Transcript_16957/g.36733  ORF Transcript_16957/g.36733 Transcript_16957/m.36733 type:complete len:140 (+) Transcript_16957:26-445(+)